MNITRPKREKAGEDWATGYLHKSFWLVHSEVQHSPIDLTCRELFQARGSSRLWKEPTIHFHFQVKAGPSYWKDGISIESNSTFEDWLLLVKSNPIFLLWINEINAGHQEYWFLALHDWLFTERAQKYLVQPDPKPHFNVERDFTLCDNNAENFHAALLREAARAIHDENSPFATTSDWTSFPGDEVWLLRKTEIATLIHDLPTSVLRLVRKKWPYISARKVRELLSSHSSDIIVISEWLDSVKRLTDGVIPCATSFQRYQLLQFVKTMNAFYDLGILLPLPPFRIGELNCWRTFVALYPRSLRMLEQIILKSTNPNDVKFAAALLPILALSEDRGVSSATGEVLRLVKKKVNQLSQPGEVTYAFQREMLRCLVESGERGYKGQLVDFVAKKGMPIHEKKFLTQYGWPANALRGNIERKIYHPTRRDENLKPLYETMANLLLK